MMTNHNSLHADQEIILIEDDDEVYQPLQLGKLT
jgi:hypothetical protein